MSITKKFNIGRNRLTIVIGGNHVSLLKPIESFQHIHELIGSCGNLFAYLNDTRNFNVSLDSSFHKEVKECLERAFFETETLKEFLNNGLLNKFNYTIKIDLTMAFKPVEITVIDGKFSGKYDRAIGYQTTALSSFERNEGLGEPHFLFSPNEFLRDPFITQAEAIRLSEIHETCLKDLEYSTAKMHVQCSHKLEGFLIPNDYENRKWVKLLITRVQNRWGKLGPAAREKTLKEYAEGLFVSAITKRFKKTMLLNNSTTVLMGTKPILNALINGQMLMESRIGIKATLDETNFVLAIV